MKIAFTTKNNLFKEISYKIKQFPINSYNKFNFFGIYKLKCNSNKA